MLRSWSVCAGLRARLLACGGGAAPVRHTPPGYPRTFCLVCGGPVPYVDEGFVGIPAGILDDDPGVRPEGHIFSEMKAPWLEMDDTLPHVCGGPTPPAQS
jgi:hypothetical protein